jgi:hypothetical protein
LRDLLADCVGDRAGDRALALAATLAAVFGAALLAVLRGAFAGVLPEIWVNFGAVIFFTGFEGNEAGTSVSWDTSAVAVRSSWGARVAVLDFRGLVGSAAVTLAVMASSAFGVGFSRKSLLFFMGWLSGLRSGF